MEIKIDPGDILQAASDLAVLGCFEDTPLPSPVAALLEPGDFSGSTGQTLLLYPRGAVSPKRLLLVGLGKREKASSEMIRRESATAIKEAQKIKVDAITVGVNGEIGDRCSNPLPRLLQRESSWGLIDSGATAPV